MKKTFAALFALLMVLSCVTVATAAKTGFSDVGEGRWSAASINYAVDKGYMKGVGGDKFDPEGSLTRAMVATVLWRREGEPAPTAPSGFSDVPAGEWYADAVAWAKETGVVKGITEKTFEPDGLITREQLATMLFRFSSALVPDAGERADLSAFADYAKVSDWANEPLGWAVAAGLVKGTDGNRLAPDEGATREQFAAIIERFDAYAENAETPLFDADFYVSPAGDDSWTGSFSRPFRTLGRAVLAARALDKTASRGGITVAVRTGEYTLFDFDLTAADSGAEECPITYRAYGDGDVVITDSFEVAAENFADLDPDERDLFGRSADHIRKADVSDVFPPNASSVSYSVTGEEGELWPARFPNKYNDGDDAFFTDAVDVSGTLTLKINNSLIGRRLSKYSTLDGVMICGNICFPVWFDHVGIGSYDESSKTATAASPTELRSYPWFGGFRYETKGDGTVNDDKTITNASVYVEGAAEELDARGEFYIDPVRGTLYVYEPSGDYAVRGKEPDPDTAAEFVTFEGIRFPEATATVYDMPIVYVDKEGDDGFRVLNLSDPQLSNGNWDTSVSEILTDTVNALVSAERPDLITISGDLAWGSESIESYDRLADLLDSTGVPWAPVMGNHDDASHASKVRISEIFASHERSLFRWGDERLGCGNYVIVLRLNGAPVHGLIMMDTHSNMFFVDDDGEVVSSYAELTREQIGWYGDVCDALSEMGVPETTMISHIPCYTYRDAFAAAFLPGVDPKTIPAGDGMQTGCWTAGYEDSFGVVHEDVIASAERDNGFFDVLLAHGSTKTLIAGHDHINNFSILYRGVRFVYSLKTGPGCYWEPELNGGTLIDISPDGAATVRHHYVTP